MREFSRREFLAGAAGAAVAPASTLRRPPGPNEQVGVVFVGVGGQGTANLRAFLKQPDCRAVAVCDVYEPHRDRALGIIKKEAVGVTDYRRLLDRKDVDAVVVSTPDHWHALPAIEACMAGKDVYVEKPVALTVEEGELMVRAARKHHRVMQAGTQQRSGWHFQDAVEYVRAGRLGKVSRVDTWITGGTRDLGRPADADPIPGLDWERWLGPAPARRFNPAVCLYNFRWFWDYAGGQMSNWGVHLLDIARWAMNVRLPDRVEAIGGIKIANDVRETPDTLDVTYTYPGGLTLTFWHRLSGALPPDGNEKHGHGIWFHGAKGELFVDRSGWAVTPTGQSVPTEAHGGSDQHDTHVRNFLECVKSRKRPNADIAEIQTTSALCHLGNIAYRVGTPLEFDTRRQLFPASEDANRLLRASYRSPWDQNLKECRKALR